MRRWKRYEKELRILGWALLSCWAQRLEVHILCWFSLSWTFPIQEESSSLQSLFQKDTRHLRSVHSNSQPHCFSEILCSRLQQGRKQSYRTVMLASSPLEDATGVLIRCFPNGHTQGPAAGPQVAVLASCPVLWRIVKPEEVTAQEVQKPMRSKRASSPSSP